MLTSPRTVDITPDKTLMEKLGSVGFTPEEAIAEFIDNAIDAQYDSQSGDRIVPGPVVVEVTLSEDKIIIRDNAAGIADFDRCLKTAWSEKSGSSTLGKFGLGMKTASMSLGRRITIVSKRIGENRECRTQLDLDEWYRSPSWTIQVMERAATPEDHYTEITIEKPYVSPSLYADELLDRLGDRFGPFIESREANVRINKRPLLPSQVTFLDNSDPNFRRALSDLDLKAFKKRLDFSFKADQVEITGWLDIMAKRSPSGRFGFNIYRGRRLIQPLVKIGILDHANNSNLFGHVYLPLDFPVAFTKNRIEWRTGFLTVKKELERICADHRRVATKMAQEKAPVVHPRIVKDVDKSLKALTEAVSESTLLKRLFEVDRKRALEDEAEDFGSVDSEKRAPRLNKTATRPILKGTRVRNPAPGKPRQKKNFWFITVGGLRIKLFHDWIDADEPRMWFSSLADEKVPWELNVQTNVSFDAFDATTDKTYYATGNVVMALSKVIHEALAQRGQKAIDVLEIQEDLYLNWSRRIKAGVETRVSS